MSSPSVDITVLDNQLGILAPVDAVLAIVAPATAGEVNTPQPFTQIQDVINEYGQGPLVEAAAYAIERFGLRVLLVRTAATGTPGAFGTLNDDDWTGTSVPTLAAAPLPADDMDIVIKTITGGTVGIAGITYQVSLDGGQNFGPTRALGTATSIVIPEANNIAVDLAAGDVEADETLSFSTAAPKPSGVELTAALTALRQTQSPWTRLLVLTDMDTTLLSALDAAMTAMEAAGRPRRAIAHARRPNSGETEAQYLTAMQTLFSASSSRRVALCAGAADIDSSVGNRWRFRRSPAYVVGPLSASVAEEVDIAELRYGPLPGVYIRDQNGNPKHHDETINPGLDDARFTTLRSWEGRNGVWVNNLRLFSPAGSDFLWMQHGLVIDLCCVIARRELEPLLSRGFLVKSDGSGQIRPEDARAIDSVINAALAREVVGQRKASSATFAISRTDDVLRTGEISWTVRVVPLAYPKRFRGTVALVASDKAAATVIG